MSTRGPPVLRFAALLVMAFTMLYSSAVSRPRRLLFRPELFVTVKPHHSPDKTRAADREDGGLRLLDRHKQVGQSCPATLRVLTVVIAISIHIIWHHTDYAIHNAQPLT